MRNAGIILWMGGACSVCGDQKWIENFGMLLENHSLRLDNIKMEGRDVRFENVDLN